MSAKTTGTAPERIACIQCRHYQVTWDPQQPYGCNAHGFKSRRNPAQVVYESSGMLCRLFNPKNPASSD